MKIDWHPAGTAPKNGNLITTRNGVVWRWMPYKANSPEAVAGMTGRWKVLRGNGEWITAKEGAEPGEWRGINAKSRAA